MNISVLSAESALAMEVIPDMIKGFLKDKNGFLIISYNENEIMGLASFSYTDSRYEVNCDYIYVFEKYREQGVSTDILEFACSTLKKAEVKRINATVIGNIEYIAYVKSFLEVQGFTLEIAYDHMLEYRLEDILNSKQFQPIFKSIPKTVMRAADVTDQQLRVFGNELAKKSVKFRISDYDAETSCFYVKDGVIRGCMLMTENEGRAKIFYTTADQGSENAMAFPGMLAACADAVSEGEKKVSVVDMVVKNEVLYKALKNILAGPEQEQIIQTYVMEL